MIGRREFITLMGGAAAALPLGARAQQPAMPVMGFLNPQSPDAYAEPLRGLRQGLKDAGYVEGENLAIEYRWADNQIERLPALAADLVRRRVAVILTTGGPSSARAAKAATTTIPVVFNMAADPVELGLVASLARPGGNLTGITFLALELTAKRLELLREMVPGATRVGVLTNPADFTVSQSTVREMEAAGRAMGLQIQVFNADTGREIEAAFESIGRERPDALFRRGHPVHGCPSHSIGPAGGVPQDPRGLSVARFCRSRRIDELRRKPARCVSSGRRLRRPHPQRRQASRTARGAVDQVRACHQLSDCPDARPHRAAVFAGDRRRGDRVRGCLLRCVSPCWHTASNRCGAKVRTRSERSGHAESVGSGSI
jgi:hypothetical protein